MMVKRLRSPCVAKVSPPEVEPEMQSFETRPLSRGSKVVSRRVNAHFCDTWVKAAPQLSN